MESLRADYTEVWVPQPVAPLVRFADRVRGIGSTGIDLVGLPGIEPPSALIEYLRSFDSVVSWYGSNRPEFRAAMPFEFLTALPPPDCRMHATDFFLEQVGAAPGRAPSIDCGPVQRERFAVIHPFSGSAGKNWPLERFRALAASLDMPVRWCAGPEEPLDHAVRFDDLFELGKWLASTSLYIGNDSGITHLAAASAPVVAIFGPTDPEVWGPRGKQVRIVRGDLENIEVEDVLAVSRTACL